MAIPGLVALHDAVAGPFLCLPFLYRRPGDSIPFAVFVAIVAFLLATAFEFAIAALAKWLLIGRLKAGRYPLWGLTYFRWWLADRLIEGHRPTCSAARRYWSGGCAFSAHASAGTLSSAR
jgi:hypothetical protein